MKKNTTVALIIENPVLLLGFEHTINSFDGFEVTCAAASSSKLLSISGITSICPQLVLADISVHQPSGIAQLQHIRATLPDSAILLLTTFDHPYVARKAAEHGATGLLSIQASAEKLHRALVSLRYTGQYWSDVQNTSDRSITSRFPVANNASSVENQLLQLLCTQLSTREIVAKTGLTLQIVEESRDILFDKFQVSSRIGLIVNAYKMGLIDSAIHSDIRDLLVEVPASK